MGAAPINFSSGEQEYVMIWQEQKKRNAQFLTYRELCILRSVTAGSAEPDGRSAFLSGRT